MIGPQNHWLFRHLDHMLYFLQYLYKAGHFKLYRPIAFLINIECLAQEQNWLDLLTWWWHDLVPWFNITKFAINMVNNTSKSAFAFGRVKIDKQYLVSVMVHQS
jgi:hypothetical protein